MQRAEGPSSRLAPEPTPTRPSLSPPVAFLLLAVVIGIIGAIFYLTRPDAPATPTNPNAAQEPDFSLTNEEAITRFEELSDIRQQAYASRDVTLLSSLYTENSVVGPAAAKELRSLNRDGVSDVSVYETQEVTVVSNSDTEIELKELVLIQPKFVDESGADVTVEPKTIREIVLWTLRLEDTQWLVHDAVITKSRVVR